jgi:hypothetical protein
MVPQVRGCSSMVELQPSKLATWVRFPSPAPTLHKSGRWCSGYGHRVANLMGIIVTDGFGGSSMNASLWQLDVLGTGPTVYQSGGMGVEVIERI